jgi:hypothetical protein
LPRLNSFGEGALQDLRTIVQKLEKCMEDSVFHATNEIIIKIQNNNSEVNFDKMTVKDFVLSSTASEIVQNLFFVALETVFTVSNFDEFNFLYFLRVLKAAGGYRPLMLTKGKVVLSWGIFRCV